jgi:hypothetical protein
VYTPVLAEHSKHFMPADAIDIGSAAGFRTECFVFACRKSLPFLRQFAGKPRDRSLGAPLAHIEGSTHLGPRKPFTPQISHPASVNLNAGPSELLSLGACVSETSPNSLLDERSLKLGHRADE